MVPLSRARSGVFCQKWLLAGWLLGSSLSALPVEDLDNKALGKEIKDLARAHRKIVRAASATQTPGKNDVWRLDLGAGGDDERQQRPALLVVAGIEGNDLAGTASALAWAKSLAEAYGSDENITKLLDTTTIYLWPRMNPDGVGHFFGKPRFESTTGDQPVDDDHDGLVDEDGPDDLDGDGLITWMRVEDPDGEFILDPAEPRLLMKADRTKGEHGAWRYLSEGRDNDGDKKWNEDGLGGVNLNRNFPYNFRFFAPWSGPHQVSDVETRALADFVVAHPNIGVVFTFGAADNLTQTPKGEAPKRPPTEIQEADVGWYRELGKSWRETLGLKKELSGNAEPGTFSDWMYFHRGRLSLAARPWSPALQLELAKNKPGADAPKDEKPNDNGAKKEDSAKTEKAEQKPGDQGKDTDSRNEEERAFLKWLDQNAKESFVPWKAFDHPDFPGKKVEVGGFAPFAKTKPPEKLSGDLVVRQGKFLTELAGKLPRIGVRRAEARHLGDLVYDVTVHVENSGYLPTALAQGNLTREVRPTRVILSVDEKSILSGTRSTSLDAIQGGDAKPVRWIVRAKGLKQLDLEVISTLGGRTRTRIDLAGEDE